MVGSRGDAATGIKQVPAEPGYAQECVHELFQKKAQQVPHAVALIQGNQRLSYTELDQQSNQVAHYLRQRGVGSEVLVGLCMDQSLRAIVGLMGIDQRRIYLVVSAIGGALAGLAACLLALQYDVHPFIGNTFGPVIFMICVLGGLGNMLGGFFAAFIISLIIAVGGYYWSTELSYVLAFTFFIVLMFIRPRGLFTP